MCRTLLSSHLNMAYSPQTIATLTIAVHAIVCFDVLISSETSAATLGLEANCTDQIIPEGESLTCECIAPPSISTTVTVSWPDHSNTSVLTVDSVRREDHGTVFTCLLEEQGQKTNTTHTLQVAYGPSQDSVIIIGPSPFVTDGTRNLTLTCDAGDMYPPPAYGWGRLCSSNTETCTFTPKLDQDGGRVLCTVFNSAIPTTVSKYYTLNLKLPTKAAAPDINVMLIAGASAGTFILAVSVVTAVCMCRRKKARPPSKEVVQSNERPESVMYRNSYYISADELSVDSQIPPFYATPLTAPQEHLPTIHEVELNESAATTNGSSRKSAHENVTYAVGGCSGARPAQQLQNGQSPALSASSMDPEPVYAVVDKSRKKEISPFEL